MLDGLAGLGVVEERAKRLKESWGMQVVYMLTEGRAGRPDLACNLGQGNP